MKFNLGFLHLLLSVYNCHYEKIGNNEPVLLEDLPFEIPESWTWVRLGDIGDWGAGATPNRNISAYYGGNIPWLKTGELNNSFVYDSEEKITEIALKNCSLRYNRIGDILIAMYGATIGKLAIAGVELTTNQACCACTPFSGIYNFYLFEFLKASKDRLIELGKGGAQPNISREKIVNYLFPLPPYDEQIRIVKELQRIMQYIELLEKNQNEYADLVEVLKKAILQSAIQGTLVEQCESDEPASVLLERIRDEKRKQLGKKYVESYIYKGDDNRYYEKIGTKEPILLENLPFEIPSSWSWARLGTLIDFSKSITVKVNEIEEDDWVLDLEDIEKDTGKVIIKKTMLETKSKSDKHKFFAGNVLYSKLRPYLNKVLIADEDGYCTTEILAFDFGKYILNHYARYFLMSSYFLEYATNGALGDMPRIRSTLGNNGLIPIPPYNEQIRICNRIKQIFDSIKDEV